MRSKHVLIASLAVILITQCSKPAPKSTSCAQCSPIILYGCDGMEWSILLPLIQQGRMPVMASLMQRGSYGYLETIEPTFSPVIWTTMATGKMPKDHGIEGFVYRVGPGEDGQRFYTSGHRATKAFWNILSDYSRTVDCLGWWMTYPAEHINGVMVAQTNTTAVLHDSENALLKGTVLRGVEDQVYPPEKQDEVMDVLDNIDHSIDSVLTNMFGTIPHATADITKVAWDQSQWAFRADELYLEVAKKLITSQPHFDLLAVYIGGTDVAAHRFWRYTYPQEFEHPPVASEIASFGKILPDYYAYVDRKLGELIAAAPKNATVIVVSDHGHHAVNIEHDFQVTDEAEMRLSGNHMDAPPGVFIAAGPNIVHTAGATISMPDRDHPIGRAWDILPTLLALEGIPLGEDFAGKPMTNIIDPEFLKKVPVRTVKTHDDKTWDAARAARMKEASDRAERLEQLRSLGYIK
ncbi:MAG TPA: alkaline phosphatase family protein [Candidatus Krumholzibacteria bacterium]|nr:alkaline phosphatase family protein [Candidatus Krumholzibacteria bacterium]